MSGGKNKNGALMSPHNPSQFLSFSSISSHFLPSLLHIATIPPPPLEEISCIQSTPSRRITHHRRPSCPTRTLLSSNSSSNSVVLATTVEHKWRVKEILPSGLTSVSKPRWNNKKKQKPSYKSISYQLLNQMSVYSRMMKAVSD
uniref:Uncharacterized protein n=1 Tax=Cucumis melo TaxID=3656 RepID=A0A9I9EAH9_CUCME